MSSAQRNRIPGQPSAKTLEVFTRIQQTAASGAILSSPVRVIRAVESNPSSSDAGATAIAEKKQPE